MSVRMFTQLEIAVDAILRDVAGDLRVAMPLGIGKPNPLINALYQRVALQPQRLLTIFTALSLLKPHSNSELENRFLQPLVERLFGNYPDLDFALDLQKNCMPPNIVVHEFFLKSGDWLQNANVQQHYISSNYTHIARDMAAQQPNLLLQAVAAREVNGELRLSLSCNPDITLDLADLLDTGERANHWLKVAMINRELPYMPGTAEVPADFFDIVIDDPACTHTLFSTPNMAVATADYAIGLHASSLVQDGGTIQIGIGSLGDAIAQALILRHTRNADYQTVIQTLQQQPLSSIPLYADTFTQGLYGCSEMFVNGLLELMHAGIIKRRVMDAQQRESVLHSGFFIGPRQFYQTLRNMPAEELSLIDMQRISFVNHLYGDEALKRTQRVKAAFINTCMMVTLSGAAVSDALDDGRVVSGVGGQYNFVAMTHELPDARSILMLRSFRIKDNKAQSNIVTHYAHCTIPRHLRDIVITEYGIADLRGKTDADVIAGLIQIADSRFQTELRDWAVLHKKLPATWTVPECYRHNTPEKLKTQLAAYSDLLPRFPFGHDFTEDELVILGALEKMKNLQEQPLELLGSMISGLFQDDVVPERYLQRMGFNNNDSIKTRLLRTLFAGNL
jgi:acyl-CoA hydrolase